MEYFMYFSFLVFIGIVLYSARGEIFKKED
jgi:hypothetical protein